MRVALEAAAPKHSEWELVLGEAVLLRRLARHYARRHSRLSADDLEQEGFLALLVAARAFDPTVGTTFRQFARQRACGAMRDAIRRAMEADGWSRSGAREMPTWVSTDASEALSIAAPPGEESEVEFECVRAILRRTLTPNEAEVVELRMVRGWTLAEVGARLGVTKQRVAQVEGRARQKLRIRLASWVPAPRRSA